MKQYISVDSKFKKLCVREFDEKGRDNCFEVSFNPELYISSKNQDSPFKTLYGEPLEKMIFDSMSDCRKYVKDYEDVEGYNIYGMNNFAYQYIYRNYHGIEDKYQFSRLNIGYLDIECQNTIKHENGTITFLGYGGMDEAAYPINAITYYDTKQDKYYLLSLYPWEKEKSELESHVVERLEFYHCSNEQALIKLFVTILERCKPHIITGWNSENFDIPYVCKRIIRVFPNGEEMVKRLSPFGHYRTITSSDNIYHKEQTKYVFHGIQHLDYYLLYKTFTFKERENYRLNTIAQIELKKKKVSYSGNLGDLCYRDPQKFNDYNVQDVVIPKELEEKLKLIMLCVDLAYDAGVNFDDAMSVVRRWTGMCFKQNADNNIFTNWNRAYVERRDYVGAYVHEPVVGGKRVLLSFDLTSLYPSIDMQWNISPEQVVSGKERIEIFNELSRACLDNGETYLGNLFDTCAHSDPDLYDLDTRMRIFSIDYWVEHGTPEYVTKVLQNHNVSMTLNFQFFRIDKQGFICQIMQKGFTKRKASKNTMQDWEQLSKLIGDELNAKRNK